MDTYGPCLIIMEEHFQFEIFFYVLHDYLNIVGPVSCAYNSVIMLNVEKIQHLRFKRSSE
jgi:hypothetical protein